MKTKNIDLIKKINVRNGIDGLERSSGKDFEEIVKQSQEEERSIDRIDLITKVNIRVITWKEENKEEEEEEENDEYIMTSVYRQEEDIR